MYLRPDLDSWAIFPWRPVDGSVARFICDVYNTDGTPFASELRVILRKAIAEAESMGYTMNVGPECEFFLFQTDEKGDPTLETHDKARYFDLTPVDLGENARRDMVIALEEMDFEIEASHQHQASMKLISSMQML